MLVFLEYSLPSLLRALAWVLFQLQKDFLGHMINGVGWVGSINESILNILCLISMKCAYEGDFTFQSELHKGLSFHGVSVRKASCKWKS